MAAKKKTNKKHTKAQRTAGKKVVGHEEGDEEKTS